MDVTQQAITRLVQRQPAMNLDCDGKGQEDEELPPVRLTLANMKSLTALLQAIKISAKQVGQWPAHLWDSKYYACVCHLPEGYRCLAWSQPACSHRSSHDSISKNNVPMFHSAGD